jgi:hypothetical protein
VRTSALVQVSCPFCGPAELPAGAVSCGVDPKDSSRGLCQFTCPSCARLVFVGTVQAAADVLLVEGARPFAGPAPFELLEAHRGAPLSWDDFLDFHLAISAAPFPQEEVMSLDHQEVVVSLDDQEVVSLDDQLTTRGRRIRQLRTPRRHDRKEG